MRIRPAALALFSLYLVLAAGARAQEGHPLAGTWAGDWQAGPDRRVHITLVMRWDGKTVTGLINPGPDAIPLTRVTPDWTTWTVRIEAEPSDTSAKPARVQAEGRLEDVGSYHRRIVGTWTQDGVKGAVTLTRE